MSKKPAPEPLPADLFWESKLADRFGVSRTALRELRKEKLSADDDWRFHNNAVVLTRSGVAKIEAVFASAELTRNDTQRPPETASGPADAKPEGNPPAVVTAPAAVAPAAAPAVVTIEAGPPTKRHFVVVRVPVHRVESPQKKIIIARPVPADFTPCSTWNLMKKLAALVDSPELRERPIRVRDNSNFQPGMVLEASNIGSGMWQYLGRLPRRPGKW